MQPLRLIPEYRERVWGGARLWPSSPKPIGEAWIVYEENRVASGPWAGRTLGALAASEGERLLGKRPLRRTGLRFPLLIKLLDANDWLSVQVHPNDEQAAQLEGPGHFGKTEAWHILEAAPGAQIISGFKPGTSREALADAIRGGDLLDVLHYVDVRAGDTVFIRAGTVHALGPGLLLYEVQQTSDITYRVFDWNRPLTAGRELHIEKSLAVSNPQLTSRAEHAPPLAPGRSEQHQLTGCEYFKLDLLNGERDALALDTRGESLHALTVIEGQARVEGEGWRETVARFETVVIPAACGAYQVQPLGAFRALNAGAG
jgi:mannose-6-phosphate isomerase